MELRIAVGWLQAVLRGQVYLLQVNRAVAAVARGIDIDDLHVLPDGPGLGVEIKSHSLRERLGIR